MKLKCPLCHKVVDRDLRKRETKLFLTKRGYKSDCVKFENKIVYLKPIKPKRTKGKGSGR